MNVARREPTPNGHHVPWTFLVSIFDSEFQDYLIMQFTAKENSGLEFSWIFIGCNANCSQLYVEGRARDYPFDASMLDFD